MKARKRELRAAGSPAPKPPLQTTSAHWYNRVPLACLALVLLSLAAYANSFSAGFALDWGPVLKDPRIREVTGEHLSQILWHSYWWPSGEAGLYRPVTTL